MPIPASDVARLTAGYTAETAKPHGPPPKPRITIAEFCKVDDVVTPTINFIMGYGEPALVGRKASDRLRKDTSRLLDRNKKLRDEAKIKSPTTYFGDDEVRDLGFLRTISRPEDRTNDRNRLFVKIMFEPTVEKQGYLFVKDIAEGMVNSGKEAGDFQAQVWLGYLEWNAETITAWGRAKTLLAARDYRKWIHAREAHKEQVRAAQAARAAQASRSLANLPSLTARQARRSGVEQEELRERWG